ncbi:MAG TPA: PAS domain S-box protein [Gemmataceae bacterium]|nr:PAS domain S-box protein [Gemmataceae bacterium]
MSALEQFRQFADLLPEAMLLLTAEGTILAANKGVEDRLGLPLDELQGQQLAELVSDAPETISPYLRACARSRKMVLGSLRFARKNGGITPCRCEGAVFRPRNADTPALLLVRLVPKETAVSQFIALNQRVTELTKEIARRTAAETALHEKSESLHVTLASIGDAVIATDEHGMVTFLNRIAESLTGWRQEEATGKPLETIFHIVNEKTRRVVENPVAKVIREGVIIGLANHTILIARDGTERPIDDSGAPIRGKQGEILGVVLVFRDISERRKSEEEIRANEEQLRLALDAGRMGTWDWNILTDEVVWSPTLEAIHGMEAGAFEGNFAAVRKTIHPEDSDHFLRAITESLQQDKACHIEYRMVWPDGAIHWLEGRGQVFHDEVGRPVRMMGIGTDIDERKRTEHVLRFLADASAALAEVVDYESTLQKVAHLAVPFFADWCTVDLAEMDGSVRRLAVAHVDPSKVSLAQELARCYPPDPNAPRGVHNVLRAGQSELMSDIPDSLLSQGAQDEEHLRILRELGLKSYMCVPLKVRGKMLGVLSFVMAESGRRYQAEDLALAEDLAHRAAVAVENARLYQELQEADRRKNEFLATLAHELRNPLAPVRNGLQIMRLASDRPDALEQARQMMDRQLGHMVRLIDDLLDVSRITRGMIELRKECVDLAAMVHSALEASRSAIEAAGHELTVKLPSQPISLYADPTRLVQIVSNILNNAARYTPQNGRIGLTVERQDEQAIVRVRDNGLGIPTQMLPRVFEMFTQVNRSLERSQGGLGIGLALVQNLVHMHSGTIEAHSAGLGQGSEFIVRLPIAPADGEDAAESPGQQAQQPDPSVGRRILVIDDNVDAADSLAMLLRMLKNEVHVAHDGPSGIDLARRCRPDLLFLDIGLPGMSGYEVARAMRQDSELRGITIVALTGWGQPEDRRRSQEAGFDEHLVKPVAPDFLIEILSHPPRRNS